VSAVGPFATGVDGLRVRLKVTPKARNERIDGFATDADGVRLAVCVAVSPENGRANAAVIALLADAWALPKSALAIVSGATSRRKTLSVQGEPAALLARLQLWAQKCGYALSVGGADAAG